MEQVSHWLAGVPRSAWIAILSALAVAGFKALAKRPLAADADGWTRIRPTIAVVGLTVLSILVAAAALLALAVVTIAIILDPAGTLGAPASWVMLLIPLLITIFGYSSVYTLFCKQRFNAEGLEQNYLGRRRFVPWAEMEALKRHWLLGPRLHPKSGRPIQFWEIYRGFGQFVAEAHANGVAIAL